MYLTFREFMGGFAVVLATLFLGWCIQLPERVQGVPAISPSADVPWTPPSSAVVPLSVQKKASPIPIEQICQKYPRLTLADIVDLALRNNPATRIAWEDARAAAARYGSVRGALFPSITIDGSFSYAKSALPQSYTGPSLAPVTQTVATANLNYLLLDFAGRSASIEEARQALLAANWNQNAVIQDTLLQVETAFFNNAGAKALLEASRSSLADADANLKAAEARHLVGMATSADVLQTKTAYAQALLDVLDAEGSLRKAKGTLAVAMGYPANTTFDISTDIPEVPDTTLTQTVTELINRALINRPDLQASWAAAMEARARITEARSRMLPTLSTSASISRIWSSRKVGTPTPYNVALILEIPVFKGFSLQYDFLQAKAEAESALEKTRSAEQKATNQVLAAYSDFLTAGDRVKTTKDLMDSAQKSAEVALGRYKAGVGSVLDLLSAQKALASARAEQIKSHLDWFIALAQLTHDVGILSSRGENPLIPGPFLGGK